jgi:cobalt-zinc-cadmium efflux system outer membrane protein
MTCFPRWQCCAFAALLLRSASADALLAQSPDSLGLSRALELARSHSPVLRIADARRDAAVGRAREYAQFQNPTLEYRRENLGSALAPDIFATMYVPFDITGRRLKMRSAGGAAQERAVSDGLADRREGELRVARAWLRAAAAQALVTVATRSADALSEVAAIDAARVREGQVAEVVGLRTRLEADRARVSLSSFVAELARARAELARTLGVSDGTLAVIGTLTTPRLPEPPDAGAAVALAIGARPELAAREAGLRESKARAEAEQRGQIGGDWQLQGGSKQTAGFLTGQIGLAVPLPLFNRNDGARQRARGELSEALAWRDDVAIGVRADAIAALTAYDALRAQERDAATFSTRGQEVSSIARTAYREGHSSLVELLDAERAAADAVTTHIRWTVDAWMARLELERALGARLDADSPLDMPLRAALPSTSR